jgi:hypothetical protein
MATEYQTRLFEWGVRMLARLEADDRVIDPDNKKWKEWEWDTWNFVVRKIIFGYS